MHRSRATARATAAALLFAACAAGGDGGIRTDESDGVRTVSSGGRDTALPWRVSPARQLALEDLPDGPPGMLGDHMIAAAPDGRVYVLDADAHRVLVFGRGGELERAFGRQGGGPGELTYPGSLSIAPDGTVHIQDYGRAAILSWSPDGEAGPSLPLPSDFWGPALRVTSDGVAYPALQQHPNPRETVMLVADDTRTLETLDRADWQPVEFPGCPLPPFPAGPLFEPEIAWGASWDRVAVAASREYRVRVFDNGVHSATLLRRTTPLRPDDEAAMQEAAEWRARVLPHNLPCDLEPRTIVRQRGVSDVAAPIRRITVTPGGMIWVERRAAASGPLAIDVFAADGAYLGTAPSGTAMPADFFDEDTYVALEADALGVQRLIVYAIAR